MFRRVRLDQFTDGLRIAFGRRRMQAPAVSRMGDRSGVWQVQAAGAWRGSSRHSCRKIRTGCRWLQAKRAYHVARLERRIRLSSLVLFAGVQGRLIGDHVFARPASCGAAFLKSSTRRADHAWLQRRIGQSALGIYCRQDFKHNAAAFAGPLCSAGLLAGRSKTHTRLGRRGLGLCGFDKNLVHLHLSTQIDQLARLAHYAQKRGAPPRTRCRRQVRSCRPDFTGTFPLPHLSVFRSGERLRTAHAG